MAPQIRVAVIGGGPAGLGVAIELGRLPFVDWHLYEKKNVISEYSSGLTIQRNTWRMLEHLGAAKHLRTSDIFRPANGHITQHRDGRTGDLVLAAETKGTTTTAPHHQPCRAHRALLQQALLKEVDQSRVRVGHKLVRIEELPSHRILLSFDNGWTDEVDLLIGADGLRSPVRDFAFPDHRIAYTGATAYRSLVRTSDALDVNGMLPEVIFWHGTNSKWVYTCPLGGDTFEITCRIIEGKDPEGDDQRYRASWGREASVAEFVAKYAEFCAPVQQLLQLVTNVQQYDFFAGPRLETVVARSSVALVGDASHPLSGAFGAGAGFALEDAFTLAGALAWAFGAGGPSGRDTRAKLGVALSLYDRVRSAHYADLYRILDGYGKAEQIVAAQNLPPNGEIRARIDSVWNPKNNWIYHYEVDSALAKAIRDAGDAQGRGRFEARL
ncbi:hypothetical protein HMPREF1624_05102 [Sporothrix schenckii ATCC 58251]|uniref:FAD-binding domain-containing protein n=1 Tax=Sporothrix schenckii (strain ATCC 58251 / de Perez 2211183) TaxID=1391915 RepID=U7PRN8_SPOS1|nr:hypothetical protein HMPREF1624_05102 [Sporothrix schenckii ATCC 58251]